MFLTLEDNYYDFGVDRLLIRIFNKKVFLTLEDASVVEQPPKFHQKTSSTRGKIGQVF